MSAYRIYELTADDHVACAPTVVECPDDAAAIERARQRLNGPIIEVWSVNRCVARIDRTSAVRETLWARCRDTLRMRRGIAVR